MKEYARRIYGFAYAKTGNTRDAEDLSQDILMELLRSDPAIARDMDAWVTGICRHVWARYLSRNKRHWESVGAAPALDMLAAEDAAALNAQRQAEYEEVRCEIAFLSRVRREVLIMYYFDSICVDDIARRLGIAPATVRWHMSRARTELKERLTMENRNGMREKVRLFIGYSGSASDRTLCGLCNDLLTQNAAWACYGKKRTVEEISRELGVPAVYLENILQRLVEMDYMRVSAGRYATNFFIRDADYQIASFRYIMEHSVDAAMMFYEAAVRLLPAIRDIGFTGCDLPETELLWHVIPHISMAAYQKATERLHREYDLKHTRPVRPDGSRHWVYACAELSQTGDAKLDDFITGSRVYAIKARGAHPIEGEQYDFALLGAPREFGGNDLVKLSHIAHADGNLSESYMEEVASLVRDGYVETDGGRYRIMIPYMTKPQHDAFAGIINGALTEAQHNALYSDFVGYMNEMDKRMPAFVDRNERNQWISSFDDFGAVMYHLVNRGRLDVPDQAIARRLATVVWENE